MTDRQNTSRGRVKVGRRTFIGWAAGTTAAAVLETCSLSRARRATAQPAPAPRPTVAQAGPRAKTVVEYWFDLSGAQAKHVESIAAKFTKEFPHIEVRTSVVPTADMPTKLATALAAGSPPDSCYIGAPSLVASLIDAGRVEPLDRFRPDIAALDWVAPIKKLLIRDGRMYMIPTNSGVLGLYYNVELYKASGLDPDRPPTTWDELLSNAKAIAKPDRAIWGHYFPTKPVSITADRFWTSYLWQAGGEWLSPDENEVAFNSAAGVEALQFYVDLVHKHRVTPMKAIDNLSMGTEFETGNIGHMTLYPIWTVRAKAMKFPVRTATLPRYKVEAAGMGCGASPIFKDSKRKEEAWLFLDWLMKPANAIEWVRGLGNLPTRLSLREEPAWKEVVRENPLIEAFLEGLPKGKPEYVGPGALEIAKQVAVGIEAAVFGKKSAKQALDEAAKEANEILTRERARGRR